MRSKAVSFMANAHKKLAVVICSAVLSLAGCVSTTVTQTGPVAVGPGSAMSSGPKQRTYSYNSNIYLNVAVPVFNPGFPLDKSTGQIDYDEMGEQGIWPQLRRSEAKRFAIKTKEALEKTKSFSAVSVVPNANTTADLFVLGTILQSDSETIELEAMVMDSSGEILGQKTFEHRVSKHFFRDQLNAEKNPYGEVFQQIGDYVYSLIISLPDAAKNKIKETTLVRYAQYYSPEEFDKYINTSIKRKGGTQYYKHELVGTPAEQNKMLKRIETLKAQDQLFVDQLQDNYDAFDAETLTAYRTWQKETLPDAVARREAEEERNTKAAFGIGLAVMSAVLASNSSSNAGNIATAAGALGSAKLLIDSFKANEDMKVHSEIIDEQGQGLDLSLSPTVMEFNDKTVELTGTASEQYEQWKAHLKSIYDLEATPNRQL
ncbi:hypothetical protein [Alteromonas sp. a30]|uniref:hypothetical protein n=1 Tax=Alteromonas sp. a30 TaxID=2730917 RepID=UPI002282B2ED|nr:hypothetical protein [Alteromonas sp. a30]MCY7296909.1 hypothetical protein [Alteromonas sp. a30]